MTSMEAKVWAAVFAAAYVREMDLLQRSGEELSPSKLALCGSSSANIADSGLLAFRSGREESDFIGEED